ncbi:MAG: undecaprenyl-phosphate glucose phosphotransferase [Pseudomonadota bacterium]|nr:undecaprenyl-phosphate glucose phosphotransferase [Pseudomonadota bacterium]
MTDIDMAHASERARAALPRLPHRHVPLDVPAVPRTLIVDAMIAVEAAIILLSALATKFLYLDAFLGGDKPIAGYFGVGVLLAVIAALAFRQFGLQNQDRLLAPSINIGRIFGALGISFLLMVAVLYLLKIAEQYSRGWMLLWFVSSFALIVAERSVVKLYARALAARGRLSQRVAIYGAGPIGWKVRNYLRENSDTYHVAGMFDGELFSSTADALPIDGGLDDLMILGRQNRIDQIIIALPLVAQERIRSVVSRLAVLPVEVQLCSEEQRLPCKVYGSLRLGQLQLLQVQRRPLSERGLRVKAAMDFTLAAIGLLLALPLFPLIALAIRVDSEGPVFFRQRRHGFNNQVIHVLKFRTMTVLEDGPVVKQARSGDNRVTRVGRILRATYLDEIPQLINVLKGEMSLVGPRPHALAHNEYYGRLVESYANRHRVKPGITGWAQVNGFRGETADSNLMRERVEHDLYYIDNWSLWLDFEVLVRTVLMAVTGRLFSTTPPALNRRASARRDTDGN